MKTLRANIALMVFALALCQAYGEPLQSPSEEVYSREDADKMIRAAESRLAPVYAPLAKQIIEEFNLGERTGIGIDLGSGPGTLILELCKGTQLHWINADINP
jgi:hypothetical protein